MFRVDRRGERVRALSRSVPVFRVDRGGEALRARGPSLFRRGSPYAIAETFGCEVVAEATDRYGNDPPGRARSLDRELRQLTGDDNTCRRVLGRLGMRFVELRGHERLGFARLGDYSAERLGWSGRQLQEITRVIAALSRLPLTEQAFRCRALGWSKARLLASVANPLDEAKWIAIASSTDVRTLATITASARAAAREQHHLPGAGMNTEEEEEERVLVRIECSKRARFLWNEARRLAPQMAGRALAPWEVAEMVAAEASSAPGPYGELWQQEPWRNFAAAGKGRRTAADAALDQAAGAALGDAASVTERNANRPRNSHEEPDAERSTNGQSDSQEKPGDQWEDETDPDPVDSPIEQELERLVELNAFELDAAMRRVRTAMQQRQARFGSTLGLFLDLRLYDQLGYACGNDYVRERLGLPDRTARDLVRVAESARGKSPLLASAYERGELSWLRVLALLPVAKPWNVSAWITRAGGVTLRRLKDEVEWALAQVDRDPASIAAMPPAVGRDLRFRDGDRRMCAHAASGDDTTARPRDQFWGVIGRIRITFLAPVSVAVLFRTVMQGFANPTEPRWLAIERMLEQVVSEWRRQPRHRDPVFERDGYRCTAPGCSSYTNLHDHHIVSRSKRGSEELSNRTTLCAWHHLRAVHGGLATATGQAPDAIDWELGLAHGRKPLLRLRGDRYFRGSSS